MKLNLASSTTLLVFCCLVTASQIASAQTRGETLEEPVRPAKKSSLQEAKDVEQAIKVFRLKSADPQMAMQVITTLVQGKSCRIAVDPRTNGLIVAGSPENLRLIEALLMKLDEDVDKKKKKTTIFALKHVPAKEAGQLLAQQLRPADDWQLQVVPDQRQNALLISASESTLKEVISLLEAIDVPAAKGQLVGKNVLVSCYWIVDQAAISERFPNWKLRDLPESTLKLLKEKIAKRTKIKNPMMAANLAVQVKIGDAKEATNVIENSGGSSIDDKSSYEIELQGTILNSPNSGSKVEMQLQMQIALKDMNRKSGASRVQTKISTPLNHPVCLGMTPVNGVDSILVLEVVEAD